MTFDTPCVISGIIRVAVKRILNVCLVTVLGGWVLIVALCLMAFCAFLDRLGLGIFVGVMTGLTTLGIRRLTMSSVIKVFDRSPFLIVTEFRRNTWVSQNYLARRRCCLRYQRMRRRCICVRGLSP